MARTASLQKHGRDATPGAGQSDVAVATDMAMGMASGMEMGIAYDIEVFLDYE